MPTTHACDASANADCEKPVVDRVEDTTHQESRNNTDIDTIVIHYTTSDNIEGSISWFKNAPTGKRSSAHYIIGRDGLLVQMVPDSVAAWHAGNKAMNRRSIGIEHVAKPGQKITKKQSDKSIALIKWLMDAYEVPKASVIPHVCIKPTSCCGDLFNDFGGTRESSCTEQKKAVHAWLKANGV